MPTIDSSAGQEERINEAELAAAAFLARYQGRTLESFDGHAAYVVVAFVAGG